MTIRRDGQPLFREARIARGPLERMLGLLPRSSMGADEALIFPRCRSLHTFFMRFSIDVMFLKGDGEVVRMFHDVPSGRMVFGGSASRDAIECRAKQASAAGIAVGQRLTWTAS